MERFRSERCFFRAAADSSYLSPHPKAVHAKQRETNQIFEEPPTVEEMLRDGKGVVKVTKGATGKLHVHPAHTATFHYQGEHGYASGQVAITATPGMTWSVSCYGQENKPEEAEKNFKHSESQIKTFFSSFRFK